MDNRDVNKGSIGVLTGTLLCMLFVIFAAGLAYGLIAETGNLINIFLIGCAAFSVISLVIVVVYFIVNAHNESAAIRERERTEVKVKVREYNEYDDYRRHF